MKDLQGVGLDVLTIGQYLQPTKKHLPVKEFITPNQFKKYEDKDISIEYNNFISDIESSHKTLKNIVKNNALPTNKSNTKGTSLPASGIVKNITLLKKVEIG